MRDPSALVRAVVSLSLEIEAKGLGKGEADELVTLVRSMPAELLDPSSAIFET